MSEPLTGSSAVWPTDRFFWAVLDAPGIRAGVLPAALESALQDELPISVEQVHAVCVPLTDGQLFVCAAKRSDLETLGPGVLSMRPESVPSTIDGVPKDVPSPELLVGRMEPIVLRRERSRRALLIAASILLSSCLVSVGLVRRGQAYSEEAQAARAATTATISQVSTGKTQTSLQTDLLQLRGVKTSAQPLTPPDAAAALVSLLSMWPKDIECETSSVSITSTTLSISLSVKDDVRPLLAALKAPVGWHLDEPRLGTSGAVTRVSLAFRRIDGGKR